MRIRRLNKNTLIISRHKDFFTSLIRKSDDSNKTNKKKIVWKFVWEKSSLVHRVYQKEFVSEIFYSRSGAFYTVRLIQRDIPREREGGRETGDRVPRVRNTWLRGTATKLLWKNYRCLFITIILIVSIEGTRGNPTSHFHDGISSQSTGLPIGETDRKDRHAYAFGFAEQVIRFNFAWLYNGLFCISGHFWMTIVCAGVIDLSGLGTDLVVYTRL